MTLVLHSDGKTWQSIPGYGVKKPGDTVTFTYTVSYDGDNLSKIKGVKTVYFYQGDKTVYEKSPRVHWQSYDNYFNGDYHKYSVKSLTVNSFAYLGNGKVQVTITTKLDTNYIDPLNPAYPGLYMREPFQGTLTQGRKFYTPTVIEWEIESTGQNLTIQIEGQGSTTPTGSKAPGTVHKNMSGNISLSAVPAEGWKFAQWVDVTAGTVQFSTTPNSLVYMDKNKTIRAVFIPENATPPPSKQEYLTVVPSSYTLFEGEYNRFKAYHHKADGSSPEVTNSCEWGISNSSVARLSTSVKGELWGLKEGVVELKARYKGMEGISNVTVIPEPIPPPPNYKPKADFTISNPTPVEGEQVHFQDDSTHEGNRYGESIVSWEWTFEKVGNTSEQNPEAIWNEVGTYKVTLRVEDQDGDSDSCTKSVVVGPAIPAAVITTSTDHFIIGREIHIDGDESTAAMDRDIKWDEMEWKFYNPNNTLAYEYTGRYPLAKGTDREKDLTNSVLNKTGNWRITLKVKDTNDNESEVTERIIHVYPDNPPIADFWLASEAIRYSYEGYDLAVRDLSTPDNPDGSLGDEIYQRIWTLYYDANNDGDAKGSGDEVIRPGDKSKAAEIIQVSNNDPRPVIRFNKTGRYQLELTVKERYEAWGEINEGLSANTDDKAIKEKQLIVINLAPTVAFDIKKKTPADILFATDYSVIEAKFNSLNSGQPAFINELESGFVEPAITIERTKKGDVGQQWSITIGSKNYIVEKQLVGDWYRIADKTNSWNTTFNTINISTGQVREDFGIIASLNDGTYIRGIYEQVYDGWSFINIIKSRERVDSNLNILIPATTYEAAIKAAMPPAQTMYDWSLGRNVTISYKLKEPIFLPNGNIFLWIIGEKTIEGYSTPSYHIHQLLKLNSSLIKTNTYNIIDIPISSSWQQTLELSHVFKNNNQVIFKHTAPGSSSYYKYTLISAGDLGVKNNLGEWIVSGGSLRPPFPELGSTGNDKFFVVGAYGNLSVYSANGLVASKAVPKGNVSGEGITMYTGKCTGILPWNDQHTAVIYQTIQNVSGQLKDDTYLYLINNDTGAIELEKQYFDILYPPDHIGTIGYVGSWGIYNFNVIPSILNSNLIGLDVYYYASPSSSETNYHYYSVINRNLEVTYTSPVLRDGYPMQTYSRGEWQTLTPNYAALHETEYFDPDGNSNDKCYNQVRIFGPNGNVALSLPRKEYGPPIYRAYSGRIGSLDNGYFYSTDNNAIQMYSNTGSLLWQKPFTGISSRNTFMDFILANPINLVNPATGTITNTISGNYFFNNNNQLVVASGGRLTGYGQLKGLQYLKQAIENHTWDNNKFNVVASVIDADSFSDFDTQKDTIKSLLQAKNLKIAVISPSTGKTKTQAEQLITQNPDGGWWVQTTSNMATPLSDLARKIIQAVNEDRGADNIVLVGQEAELKANYNDLEDDPADRVEWAFSHDNENLGSSLKLVKKASISSLHNKKYAVMLDGKNQNQLDIVFDQAGTYKVYAKAQDYPVTTDAYLTHEKAGKK